MKPTDYRSMLPGVALLSVALLATGVCLRAQTGAVRRPEELRSITMPQSRAQASGRRQRAAVTEGVVIILTDSSRPSASRRPEPIALIHDGDLQHLIKLLARSGAKSITLDGLLIDSPDSIRCLGPNIRVKGKVVNPPFVVRASGAPDRLIRNINESPGPLAAIRRYDPGMIEIKAIRSAPEAAPSGHGGVRTIPAIPHVGDTTPPGTVDGPHDAPPGQSDEVVRSFHLRFKDAATVMVDLSRAAKGAPLSWLKADYATNTVSAAGSPAAVEAIQKHIEGIDVPNDRCFLQTTIHKVTVDRSGKVDEKVIASPSVLANIGQSNSVELTFKDRAGRRLESYRITVTPGLMESGAGSIDATLLVTQGTKTFTASRKVSIHQEERLRIAGALAAPTGAAADPGLRDQVSRGDIPTTSGPYTGYYLTIKPRWNVNDLSVTPTIQINESRMVTPRVDSVGIFRTPIIVR